MGCARNDAFLILKAYGAKDGQGNIVSDKRCIQNCGTIYQITPEGRKPIK